MLNVERLNVEWMSKVVNLIDPMHWQPSELDAVLLNFNMIVVKSSRKA